MPVWSPPRERRAIAFIVLVPAALLFVSAVMFTYGAGGG